MTPVADPKKKEKSFASHNFAKASAGEGPGHHHVIKTKKASHDDHVGDDLLASLATEKQKKRQDAVKKRQVAMKAA